MALIYLDEVPSTNDWARAHIGELADRSVVYTSRQSAGRGRLQRRWIDLGEGNLFASLVLKPGPALEEHYLCLTQLLSVNLVQTLAEFGVSAAIKWPNDVLIGGRKLCGILAEALLEGTQLQAIVLGFGVNLRARPADLRQVERPVTALNLECGSSVEPGFFLQKVLRHFFSLYTDFMLEGFTLIRDQYLACSAFIGREVTVSAFGREVTGIAAGIDLQGRLQLQTSSGQHLVVSIGDIA